MNWHTTHWEDNWSAGFAFPMLGGGLMGFTQHVSVTRHCPLVCKPGLWRVALTAGSEVLGMVSPDSPSACNAVMDDFGDLVRVEQ